MNPMSVRRRTIVGLPRVAAELARASAARHENIRDSRLGPTLTPRSLWKGEGEEEHPGSIWKRIVAING
jgi:hypothetical protein